MDYKCPTCGKDIEYGVNFCPHCGAGIEWNTNNNNNDDDPPKWATALFSIIMWAAIIGGGIYGYNYFFGGSSDISSITYDNTTSNREEIEKELEGKAYTFTGPHNIKYSISFESDNLGILKDLSSANEKEYKFSYRYSTYLEAISVDVSHGGITDFFDTSYFYMKYGYIFLDESAMKAKDFEHGFKLTEK